LLFAYAPESQPLWRHFADSRPPSSDGATARLLVGCIAGMLFGNCRSRLRELRCGCNPANVIHGPSIRENSTLSEDQSNFERRLIPTLIVVFAGIAVLVVLDFLADMREGTTVNHLALEAGVALAALAGIAALVWRIVTIARGARAQAVELNHHLERSRQDAVVWRTEAQDLLAGLAARIDSQFEKWNLTPAEKDTALFLLKGFSHKDVARLRKVSEATARQQARAIYRKAGINGRHDLAAFFLEDLVLPPDATRKSA